MTCSSWWDRDCTSVMSLFLEKVGAGVLNTQDFELNSPSGPEDTIILLNGCSLEKIMLLVTDSKKSDTRAVISAD